MESLWLALAKIGGLAAIGGLIDHAMRKHEKQRLTDWLIHWWDRFDSVKWSNFGRKEAELVIQLLDRYAGRRLLSWQRLRFVAIVSAGTLLVSIVWTAIRFWSLVFATRHLMLEPSLIVEAPVFEYAIDFVDGRSLAGSAVVALLFGFSISVTRLVSVVAARLSVNLLATVATFCALLIVHLLLLFAWVPVFLDSMAFALAGAVACLFEADCHAPLGSFYSVAITVLRVNLAGGADRIMFNLIGSLPFRSIYLLNWCFSEMNAGGLSVASPLPPVVELTFQQLMGLLANGLRIAAAVVFLGSFVFRPLIQAPISRLWAGFIESGRPIFSTLFGALGAVIVIIGALAS